jgi:hypothetical protein
MNCAAQHTTNVSGENPNTIFGENKLSAKQIVTLSRELQEFNRLELCDPANWVELVITSGDKESLTIQAPAELIPRIKTQVRHGTLVINLGGTILEKILDALTTSLTRQKVTYHLTVCRLDEIFLCGLISLDTQELENNRPVIRRLGPGYFPLAFNPPFVKSPPGWKDR